MNFTDQIKLAWKGCLIAFFAITLSIVAPTSFVHADGPTQSTPAAGASDQQITKIICNAVNQLTGGIGRAIAILIIISLAISLFLGKVSWGMAIAVAVGMGILFGAKGLVDILAPATDGTGKGVCGS
ncbi:MAG: type secretion system protein VirB2 [Candidatus Midichloriaceae bacterium]|jgi:type IV secretion system protein VirB2|nr:type secretion system protein VirB2 [Candidatus Midichloriaceae bacterium]